MVTGASRGIGRAVAKSLAMSGAHVIAMARTTGALEALDDDINAAGGQATLIPQDLADLGAIDTLGPALAEKFGRLDIFVGNAGMLGTLGPLTHAGAKEWAQAMDINVNANFRLLRTLDPLLRASDAGRVIVTTSGLARREKAYWGLYCASKAALEMMVKVYAAETAKTDIRVNLVDPGLVETAMLKEAYPGGLPEGAKSPEDVVETYLALASPLCEKHGSILNVSDYRERVANG